MASAEHGVNNVRVYPSLRTPSLLVVREIAALLLGQWLAVKPVQLHSNGGLQPPPINKRLEAGRARRDVGEDRLPLLLGQRAILIRSDQPLQVRTRHIGIGVSDCQHCLCTLPREIEILQDAILLVIEEAHHESNLAAWARIELRVIEVEPAASILGDPRVQLGRSHQAHEGRRKPHAQAFGLRREVTDLVTRLRAEALARLTLVRAVVRRLQPTGLPQPAQRPVQRRERRELFIGVVAVRRIAWADVSQVRGLPGPRERNG